MDGWLHLTVLHGLWLLIHILIPVSNKGDEIVINIYMTRHRENFWAFTGPKTDFGRILLILNMIIHRSFTGPTHLLSANVLGPVSFAVSAWHRSVEMRRAKIPLSSILGEFSYIRNGFFTLRVMFLTVYHNSQCPRCGVAPLNNPYRYAMHKKHAYFWNKHNIFILHIESFTIYISK